MRQPVTVMVGAPEGSPTLSRLPETVDLVGQVNSGRDAVARILTHVPDVVVIDVGLDDVDPSRVCHDLLCEAPACRVLTVGDDDDHHYATLAAGAFAAVDRTGDTPLDDRVVDAATRMVRGESLLPRRAARRLLDDVDRWTDARSDPICPPPSLTGTEREVLLRLGTGRSPAEIAADHSVTEHLVNLHTGYAVAKLHRYLVRAARLSAPGADTPGTST